MDDHRIFSRFSFVRHGEGASPDLIAGCESTLGVTIRGSYRKFLEEVGWAYVSAKGKRYDILGLSAPNRLDDVTATTLSERNDVEPELPTHLIPICADGYGNHWCLDTSQAAADENPVVFFDHDLPSDQVSDRVSSSFIEWLDSL